MRSLLFVVFCVLTGCQVAAGTSSLAIRSEVDAGPESDAGPPSAGTGGKPTPTAGSGGTGGTMMRDAGPQDAAPDADPPDADPCMRPEGSECNWLEQCGCEEGEICQARGADAKGTCVKAGKRELGETCKSADECKEGTCDQRVCREYCTDRCDEGRCLPATVEGNKPSDKINVCWQSCQAGSDSCESGTTCQTMDMNGMKAAFCLPPADPCPTTEDGQCDEPVMCAAGTDSVDCSCKKDEGAECNLVAQCGCQKGKSCEFSDKTKKATCVARPPDGVEEGGLCADDLSCKAGRTCTFNALGGSCKKYCDTSTDCSNEGDECRQVTDGKGQDVPGFKICAISCSEARPCPESNSCLKTETGSFCFPYIPEIPGAECNLTFQMGCDFMSGVACRLDQSGSEISASCQAHMGQLPAGSACTSDTDCEADAACHWGTCRSFCDPKTARSDAPPVGCLTGLCEAPRLASQDAAPFSLCMMNCASDSGCDAGLQCMSYRSFQQGGLCVRPETTNCPTNDGKCDEPMPRGTGLCAPGFDTADCMVTP